MRRLIEKDKHPIYYVVKRAVAAIVLAFLISSGLLIMTNETVRAQFLGWVSRIFDGGYVYQSTEDRDIDVSHYSIKEIVPEGYSLANSFIVEGCVFESYENEKGLLLNFQVQRPDTGAVLSVSMEESDAVKEYRIGKYDGKIYYDTGGSEVRYIVWQNEKGVLFTLGGWVNEDALIDLAEKICSE